MYDLLAYPKTKPYQSACIHRIQQIMDVQKNATTFSHCKLSGTEFALPFSYDELANVIADSLSQFPFPKGNLPLL